jgi:phage terminase large subunit-like protein
MNPVLRWMIDNVSVRTGPSGNIMPQKPEHKMSHKKIDGVVSLIMALDRALRNDGVVDTGSIYEERGVLTL